MPTFCAAIVVGVWLIVGLIPTQRSLMDGLIYGQVPAVKRV